MNACATSSTRRAPSSHRECITPPEGIRSETSLHTSAANRQGHRGPLLHQLHHDALLAGIGRLAGDVERDAGYGACDDQRRARDQCAVDQFQPQAPQASFQLQSAQVPVNACYSGPLCRAGDSATCVHVQVPTKVRGEPRIDSKSATFMYAACWVWGFVASPSVPTAFPAALTCAHWCNCSCMQQLAYNGDHTAAKRFEPADALQLEAGSSTAAATVTLPASMSLLLEGHEARAWHTGIPSCRLLEATGQRFDQLALARTIATSSRCVHLSEASFKTVAQQSTQPLGVRRAAWSAPPSVQSSTCAVGVDAVRPFGTPEPARRTFSGKGLPVIADGGVVVA